jgi:hypothetical protein
VKKEDEMRMLSIGILAAGVLASAPCCAAVLVEDGLSANFGLEPRVFGSLEVPEFDPGLGTLTGVFVSISGTIELRSVAGEGVDLEMFAAGPPLFPFASEGVRTFGHVTEAPVDLTGSPRDVADFIGTSDLSLPLVGLEVGDRQVQFGPQVLDGMVTYTYVPVNVPEAPTWAMMLIGLGLVGWRGWGRRLSV